MSPSAPSRSGTGRVVVGLVLVAIGVAWLLASTGAIDLDWAVALPAALVLVGVGVLASARSGGSGGLIALGVVLTVLSITAAIVSPALAPDVLGGGMGDREERPIAVDDPAEFRLAAGTLTVDLRDVDDLPHRVDAAVGLGELVVIVPDDVDLVVRASVAAGEVHALDERRDGVGARVEQTFPADGRSRGTLDVDAAVTLGQVEVRR